MTPKDLKTIKTCVIDIETQVDSILDTIVSEAHWKCINPQREIINEAIIELKKIIHDTQIDNIVKNNCKKKLDFVVRVGYDNTHLPIEMEIKDIIEQYPNIKTLQDLNEVLQDNDNTLF